MDGSAESDHFAYVRHGVSVHARHHQAATVHLRTMVPRTPTEETNIPQVYKSMLLSD